MNGDNRKISEELFLVVAKGKAKEWFYGGKYGDVYPFVFMEKRIVSNYDIMKITQFLKEMKMILYSAKERRESFILQSYEEMMSLRNKILKLFRKNEMKKYIERIKRDITHYKDVLLERLIMVDMYLEVLHRVRVAGKIEGFIFTKEWIMSHVPEKMKKLMEKIDRKKLEEIPYLYSRTFWLSRGSFIELYKEGEEKELMVIVRNPFIICRVNTGENVFFEFYCAMGVDFVEYALGTVKKILEKHGKMFGITKIEIDRENRVFIVS